MRSPSYSYPVTSSDLQYSDVSNKKQYNPFEMMNIARIVIIERNLEKATEIRESIKNNLEISDDAELEQRLDIINKLIINMEQELNSAKPDDYESNNDIKKRNELIKYLNNQYILGLEQNMMKIKNIKENLKHDRSISDDVMLERLDKTNTTIREIEEQLNLFKSNGI